MADVRALLRAKRVEQRIVHPFAAYSQSGVLRCTACDAVIKHASAWNGHLGSKSHRTHATRLKEEERSREAEKRQGKRKVTEEEDNVMNDSLKKRKVDADDVRQEPSSPSALSVSVFPADFFSDPSRSLTKDQADSDDEVDPPPTAAVPHNQSTLDLEWVRFQEAVINAPSPTVAQETFERATVFADPQLSTEVPEGFPSSVAPQIEPQSVSSPAPKSEENEQRRAEEEKELILDRLLDEERAQEEADERVTALKAKFDLLKQKRMVSRAAKIKR